MTLEISFGALSPSIGEQLRSQGLTATKDDVTHWESDRKALTRLRVRGLLPDATAKQAERRLFKRILSGVTLGGRAE